MRYFRTGNTDWLAALPLVLCLEANAQAPLPICNAPIVLDGSTPGTVLGNNQITIQGGLLSGDGTNLFHNLSCFNVPTNGSATFQNPAQGINNVVARVTGGELSTIGGDLNTSLGPTGSGRASVFLLNPNGVLFNGNTNANLNSLVVSTANSIGFDGGATLTPGSTAQDLVAVTGDPIHFGNLDSTAKVTFDGARVMMTNQGDLVLVAKDVELGNGSRIITEGAQVVVAAAGGGNSVTLDVRDRNTLPTFDQPATGNVEVAGSSGISTSHASGGRIVIRGGVLTLTNTNPNQAALNVADAGGDPGVGIDIEATQRVTLSRSQISTGTSFSGTASDIRISAPLIQMDSESAGVNTSAIRTNGRGGDIHIEASSELNIRDGEISTIVTGGGTGGNIAVDTERLTITDRSSILSLVQSGTGGNIRINVGRDITIDGNGATRTIIALPQGLPGTDPPEPDITIIPETVGIIANTVGTGQGGEISVEAKGDIILRNGGLIDSSSFSRGNAGKISVQAQNLSIDGENFAFATGITSFTVDQSDPNAGRGGDIGVNVPGSITLLNGGEIDTSSFGAGDAGRISIGMSDASTSLAIDKGTATRFTGIGSDASGSGDAGEVAIRTGALSIANGGQISTGVFFSEMVPFSGIGNGGDVNVFADSLRVSGTSPGGDDGTSIVPNSAIFAGTQAGMYDFDIPTRFVPCQADHLLGKVLNLYWLTHVEYVDPAAFANGSNLHDQLAGFGYGHEIPHHFGMSHSHWSTPVDLFTEQGHDTARGVEHIAKSNRNEMGVGMQGLVLTHDFGGVFAGAHQAGRVDRLVGRNQDKVLDLMAVCCCGQHPGTQHVVAECLTHMCFQQRHVFESSSVKNQFRLVLLQYPIDQNRFADIAENCIQDQFREFPA